MGDASMTVYELPTSTPTAASTMNSPSNARTGMHCQVYEAAESGSVDVLQWSNNWKQEKTATGNNVLHVHVGKPIEIHKGVVTHNVSLSFIQYVVDETFDNSALLQSNHKGDTPLHFAARFGHTVAVQEFLTRIDVVNAGLLNVANSNKDMALHDATRAGHAHIVTLLVKAAGVNALHHMPNNLGETPLLLAAERGCFESFTAIIEHTCLRDLEHKGPCGQTALHLAVMCRNKDIVDRILELDTSTSQIKVKNDEGQTPLHCCAAWNVKKQLEILRSLLDHDDEYNSAAYIQDNEGRTPLHVAILNSNFNGAKLLIRSYPDCIEMVDNKGQNVVHSAANLGCLNKFERFLRKVPKCNRLMNKKDDDGNTPLHLLVATTPALPIHGCFIKLPLFLKRHKNLDVRVFNNKNLTAGDTIACNDNLHHVAAPRQTSKILPKGRRVTNWLNRAKDGADRLTTICNNENNNKGNLGEIEERINHLRKAGETRLVVATLIATVSFTAGFTVPGGFDQSPGKTIGLAVLSRKASFIVFLVSDTIAFTMSSLAVICYFSVASQKDLVRVDYLSNQAHFLNSISLGALMIAFVSGVYAVVSQFRGLAFTIVAISLFYFFFYLFLLVGSWKTVWAFMTRNTAIHAHEYKIGFDPSKYHM